jgi:hypothetical protein
MTRIFRRTPTGAELVGWRTLIITAAKVVVAGPNGGVFIYSGAPAFGNLVSTDVAVGGTDPFGNTYLPGKTEYSISPAAPHKVTAINIFQSTISWQTAPNPGGSFGAISSINAVSQSVVGLPPLSMTIGQGNTGEAVTFADPVVAPVVATAPGTGVAESWHSLGTLAGYTITRAQYRLNIMGEVEFDISIGATAANALTVNFSNTLPAAYQPLASYTLVLSTNLSIASWTAGPPRLGVTAAGVVSFSFMTNQPSGTNFGVVMMPTT